MANEYLRKTYGGAVPARTLAVTIDNDDLTVVLNDGTNWPTASNGPFVISIGRNTPTEEKVLISARTGASLTVHASGRGYDGTAAVAHTSGAAVEHVLDAASIDQVNRMANLMDEAGQLMGHNGTNPTAVPAPTSNNQFLASDDGSATGLSFVDIPDVVSDPSAPSASSTVYKLWVDETLGIIRSSDGAQWNISKTVLVFGSSAGRTAALGDPPPNGLFSAIGTRLYVSLGGVWLGVGNNIVVAASQPDPTAYQVGDVWARPVT